MASPGSDFRRRASALLLALALPAAALASEPGSEPAAERLTYRWRLLGLFGALSGLFFPGDGEGELSSRPAGDGRRIHELVITARAETGDFFRYGAELDVASGRTLRAWSSQLWRGKRKEKASPITDAGVVDVASAIALIRRERPTAERDLEIWSDGKLYPVRVRSEEGGERLLRGQRVATRRFAVRPLTLPDRRVWKGELDLWLADDAAATPVEILVARPPARVRLEIVGYAGGGRRAATPLLDSSPP